MINEKRRPYYENALSVGGSDRNSPHEAEREGYRECLLFVFFSRQEHNGSVHPRLSFPSRKLRLTNQTERTFSNGMSYPTSAAFPHISNSAVTSAS